MSKSYHLLWHVVPGSSHCWQGWQLLLAGARGATQSCSTQGTPLCPPPLQPSSLPAAGRALCRENASCFALFLLQPQHALNAGWQHGWRAAALLQGAFPSTLSCAVRVPLQSTHQALPHWRQAQGMAAPLLWVGVSGKASSAQKMCRNTRQPSAGSCCCCALCWDLGAEGRICTRVQHLQHVAQADSSLSTSSIMDSKQRKGKITSERKVLISQLLITQDYLCFKPSNFR